MNFGPNFRFAFMTLVMLGAGIYAGAKAADILWPHKSGNSSYAIDSGTVLATNDAAHKFGIRSDIPPDYKSTKSGDYLIGMIAQKRHDWATASRYFQRLLRHDPDNVALRRRAMILLLGSGDLDDAADIASGLLSKENHDDMAAVVLSLKAVKDNDYNKAGQYVDQIQSEDETRIVKPLINAWIEAGKGKSDVDALLSNPLYIYDAVAVTTFLGEKDKTDKLIQKALNQNGIVGYDLERIGDLFAQLDLADNAQLLYKAALKQQSKDTFRLNRKISALEDGSNIDQEHFIVHPPNSTVEGLAQSIFDISMILFRQGADNLSRLYASMAVSLKDDFIEARLLLAHIMAYEGQLDEALEQYVSIPPESASYLKAQRQAAEILEEAGHHKQAIETLRTLEKEYGDIKARVQIGNIYRRAEDFSKALKSYNRAYDKLKDSGEDMWNIYYLRGMTHERLKNYEASDRDLEKALNLRPNNPYILNYLGYSLADRGRNLEKALEYIRKAVELEPDDGYITDSLGWVLYRMGEYEKAVPHLERAVELLPYDAVINDHLGDAYWQVGREVEARFQWRRALNHSEDSELTAKIETKMELGLDQANSIRAARNEPE